MNTFGQRFRFTSAGESHGEGLVGIIDGMPAGIRIDFDSLDAAMRRRRPGHAVDTARHEPDMVRFISGLMDGVTLGTPIAFLIENKDVRSGDYEHLRRTFRPGHADYTYQAKYGIRDHRGGGRASARETALRVVAGELAAQVLAAHGIHIYAYVSRIGSVALNDVYNLDNVREMSPDNYPLCPDAAIARAMLDEIETVRAQGDTVGGVVSCIVTGLPAGVGEPVADKLQAVLAAAMMSIPAAHGFEYGMGFAGAAMRGSQVIDEFCLTEDGRVATRQNHSGGIQGGISNGMPVTFSVAFKPVATMMRPVRSIGPGGVDVVIEPRGRHDVCVVPRAVEVVRAMAAMTLLDMWMSR